MTLAHRSSGGPPELDVLQAGLVDTRLGHTSVVVEGAPGVGKTRLVEQFVSIATSEGTFVVWGTCYEGTAAPSWWPWLGILTSIVEAAPSSAGPGLDQLLQPSPDDTPTVSPTRRFELHEAVRRTLTDVAAQRPLVVVLDDVQWADETSTELLAHLTRTLGDAPVLVVVLLREPDIGRSNPVTHVLGALARHPAARRIALRGLPEDEIAELVAATTGTAVSVALVDAINHRAEGNPFFAIELVRDHFERGGDERREPAPGTVPASLADVVRQRLDRLPPATRSLLQVAAVIGPDVESSLLLRAADRGADAFDDLEPAFSNRFLDEVADSPGQFRFTHTLFREVLVNEITTLREARLHLRVADAIEARPERSDNDVEILAEHLYAARSLGVGARATVALATPLPWRSGAPRTPPPRSTSPDRRSS